MRKIHYALLFIAVAAVLLVALFVGRAYKTEAITDQIGLVPETASIVGYVQLSQVIKDGDIAEIYTVLPKEAGDPQTIQEALVTILDTSHLDLRDFDSAWIFGDVWEDIGEESYFGAILKGTFKESSLLASMIRTAAGEEIVVVDHLGYTIYREPGQQLGFAVLTRDLLLYGSIQAIKDIISVSEGNMAPVNPDLVAAYEGLGHAMVKLVAAIPPGLIEEGLQELTAGIRTPPALNSLADLKLLSVAIDKKGQSIDCTTHLCFSNKDSANTINGLIPLVPLMIGAIDLPDGSVIQYPERALALLPELLTRSEFGTHGSCVTIRSVLNAANIEEAMSAAAPPTGLAIDLSLNVNSLTSDGLGISIDTTVTSHLGLQIDIGDLMLAVTNKNGQTYITERITGTSVPNNSSATFHHDLVIPLELAADKDLLITVHTTAHSRGMSMPLSCSIELTTPGIETLIATPEIHLGLDFGDIASDGLHMGLQATITNSNPFGIDVGDLQIVAKDQLGNVILTRNMKGCSLEPDSVGVLSTDILMPLEIISEPNIVITIQTQAGFAGISLPIGASLTISMPDLKSMTVPEMDLLVYFGKLTSGGLHLELQTTVTNPNLFGINVGDLQIVATGHSGNVLLTTIMKGCSIGPDSTGTLSGNLLMPLDVLSESTIVIKVQTQAGFAGLSLPINARITVKMPNIATLITVPEIDLGLDFGDISSDGLHMGLQTSITNPNPFGIHAGDLLLVTKGQSGNVIFTTIIEGCSIGPGSTGTLSGNLLMPLDALNERTIVITVQTQAGFAGVSLPISAKLAVSMPDIGSLIKVPRIEAYTEMSLVPGFPLPELCVTLASTIPNSNSFDFVIDDVKVTFFDSQGELVKEMTIPGGQIEAHSSRTFSGSVTLSASEYLSLISGDQFRIEVATRAGISGVNAMIPIETVVVMAMVPSSESPNIDLDLNLSFWELTPDGLHVGLQIDIDNPSPFGIYVDDLRIEVKDQEGNVLLTAQVKGGHFEPYSTSTLLVDLLIPLDVLDELDGSVMLITAQTLADFAEITFPLIANLLLFNTLDI